MTRETLILVGREATSAVLERHAARLRERDVVDAVTTATYGAEPAFDLAETFRDHEADRTYVVPMCFAHTYETTEDVPRALSSLSGEVRYCDPVGESPAVTELLRERAAETGDDDADEADTDALLLVALGNSGDDYGRDTAEYHAERLRSDFEEVRTAYLLQSPAVECARYTLDHDSAVVVPLFVAECEATRTGIPEKLELDRGGFEYADPFGAGPQLTEAIHAEVERERVLADGDSETAGTDLVADARPVATDGRGRD
ncbi:CbiX/SirB N-terminal domain-containing protein [Haloparvum sp. PAK95]|uniref:CbiX/SirB N-terminal domain-containing protein n=1 Tax=Haloparvum sp. PAK95 TaxID=3418962 RepID=UPI003D2ECAB8